MLLLSKVGTEMLSEIHSLPISNSLFRSEFSLFQTVFYPFKVILQMLCFNFFLIFIKKYINFFVFPLKYF